MHSYTFVSVDVWCSCSRSHNGSEMCSTMWHARSWVARAWEHLRWRPCECSLPFKNAIDAILPKFSNKSRAVPLKRMSITARNWLFKVLHYSWHRQAGCARHMPLHFAGDKVLAVSLYMCRAHLESEVCIGHVQTVRAASRKRHGVDPDARLERERCALTICAADFAVEWLRPLPPSLKFVGPILPEPARPLPADLEVKPLA